MPSTLNVLPVRVPIGRATDSTGKSYDVFMTPEFARAMSDLMARVGGPSGFTSDELSALFTTETTDGAALATLQHKVLDLAAQLEAATATNARLAAIEQRLQELATLAHLASPKPVDWEHPGRIGDRTPNTARVTTLNKITFTQPANAATVTLADGKTFTVTNSIALAGVDGKTFTLSNTLGLSGTDGAFLNIGTGGTLGSAAYSSASAFAARSSTALAAVGTDPASTQALANSIRSVLLSVGIGT